MPCRVTAPSHVSTPSTTKPWSGFSVTNLDQQLEELQRRSQQPDFWHDQSAATTTLRQISAVSQQRDRWNKIASAVRNLNELADITASNDPFTLELQQEAVSLQSQIEELTLTDEPLKTSQSQSTLLHIYPGAGGTEAHYWALTLLEMYSSWAALTRRPAEIINISHAEVAGIRQATLAVDSDDALEILENEAGVHRLSRISTFDPKGRRHTSFAHLEVIPDLKPGEMAQEPHSRDLKVQTFHASGPGGQHIQKVATAVRITHSPTGITVSAQSERSQKQNREHAMRILVARIRQREAEQHRNMIEEASTKPPRESWGNRIRSYILNPKQMVIDHRTGRRFNNARSILQGDISELLRHHS